MGSHQEYFLYGALIILLLLILMHFSNPVVSIYDRYLYFDYNGTTPPHKAVARKVYESSWLGNPSGVYAKLAQSAVESARYAVAGWLSSPGQSCEDFLSGNYVIFNSGASEGNNHVIRGIVEANRKPDVGAVPHIVMSAIEHKTSIDCAKRMKELGLADVSFIEPAADGRIDPASVGRAIKDATVLVSVLHYGNETGAINDIPAIGQAVRLVASMQNRPILFHVDAVQSFGKTPIPMLSWGIDALTMSYHKIYGPSGLGTLIVRKSVADGLGAQIQGTQNYKLRGGTENTASIAAIPITMQLTMKDRLRKNEQMQRYKEWVVAALASEFTVGSYSQYYGKSDDYEPYTSTDGGADGGNADVIFLGPTTAGLPDSRYATPNTLYFAIVKRAPLSQHFCNIRLRDTLFEKHRVIVSIGSACSASSGGSYVLTSLKAPYIIRCGVVRISFGDPTTWTQVRTMSRALITCIHSQ
jgi:cysteine desulfurase